MGRSCRRPLRSDFTTFRHDSRRLLPPEHFADVEALYLDTARRVHQRPVEPTIGQVVEDLTEDLDACTTLDAAVTVLRATQAGLYKRGWMLGADLEKTVSRLCHPERGLALSDSEWRLLRAYGNPERAAACALNAAGVPNNDMARLTVADATDGAWLLATLPSQAEPCVPRAQRLHRLAQGRDRQDPFITTSTAVISAYLRDARRDLGLRLANRLVTGEERNVRLRGQLGLYLNDMRQAVDLR